MNRKEQKKQAVGEREKTRWLLFFYDFLCALICYILVFVLHISTTKFLGGTALLVHGIISFTLIFGCRFLFHVYKLIWRNGRQRAYVFLILADSIGGGAYVLTAAKLLPWIIPGFPIPTILQAVMFVTANLLISLIARVAYLYLYSEAKKDGKNAELLRRILQPLTMTDFDSDDGGTMRLMLTPDELHREAINSVQHVARQFAIRGEVKNIAQITRGYINRTYIVETLSENHHVHKYILQRINTNVFKDPDALMRNYLFVTAHLRGRYHLPGTMQRKGLDEGVPAVRTTKDGRAYYKDDSGCWRVITCIDNTYGMDVVTNPETFYHAGQAFGLFIKEMADIPQDRVEIVIPNFHNVPSRFADLEKAISEDVIGRVKDVEEEIRFVRERIGKADVIHRALENKEIPLRICHNDCNLNNILFDKDTDLPVAIIDLDTVMPSTPLYDFGDSMRAGTNTARDDEKDLSKVSCDLSLYEKYARGYLEACGDILTERELKLLPYASLVITIEDGIRFLTDHINGDTYFNIYYPGQNLDRCRTQLKLVQDMEEKLPKIREILENLYEELHLKNR